MLTTLTHELTASTTAKDNRTSPCLRELVEHSGRDGGRVRAQQVLSSFRVLPIVAVPKPERIISWVSLDYLGAGVPLHNLTGGVSVEVCVSWGAECAKIWVRGFAWGL